ncbi:MAG: SpoIID/LytB domain-containing protein [bacterium]
MSLQTSRKYAKTLIILALALLFFLPLAYYLSEVVEEKYNANYSSSLISAMKKIGKPDYKTEIVGVSHTDLRIKEGEEVRVWVDYKNVGKKTWYNFGDREFIAMNTAEPRDRISPFQAADWDKDNERYDKRPNRMYDREISPGNVTRFYITLKAPYKPGKYKECFQLVSEWREWIEGSGVSFNIEVYKNEVPTLPKNGGPILRVGILAEINPVEVSSDGAFEIRDYYGNLVALYHEDEIITVSYKNGEYTLSAPATSVKGIYNPQGWQKVTKDFPRFIPKNGAVMQIVNYEDRPNWNPSFNYNRYHGNLEVRMLFGENERMQVINELPLEHYIRGLAETSNNSHAQFQKALSVVERTYAYILLSQDSKHASKNYNIDNYYDQVYKGVTYEFMTPNISTNAKTTLGEMVKYKGDVVVTPYFSHSDGRTRSWTEVWGGSKKPWLKGVDDSVCGQNEMLGHGVGMSACGALKMAEAGKKYKKILKYYYSEVNVAKMY